MSDEARARDLRLRLEAGSAAVEIAPGVGGRIAALEVDGWDLLRRDGWTDREWGSFVMAPWAGRLRDGRVDWRGRAWWMPATEPPHALHGTVVEGPWAIVGTSPTSARLETGLGQDWPFAGRIAREVTLLPDRLVDRLEVHADTAPFPAIVGWHPWFRRHAERRVGGERTGPVEVLIEARERVVTDPEGLPTGEVATPSPGLLDEVLRGVGVPPVVRWLGGPVLELHSPDTAAWVVYTAHPDGVCVEPVTGIPDGLNGGLLGEPPVAAPGSPLVATFEIRWGAAGA